MKNDLHGGHDKHPLGAVYHSAEGFGQPQYWNPVLSGVGKESKDGLQPSAYIATGAGILTNWPRTYRHNTHSHLRYIGMFQKMNQMFEVPGRHHRSCCPCCRFDRCEGRYIGL